MLPIYLADQSRHEGSWRRSRRCLRYAPGGGGLAELQRYLMALAMARGRAVGRGAVGAALTVIGCLHLRYMVVRARNPVALPLNQVLRYRLWFDTS